MRFDHAGVATRDGDALADLFGRLLDAPVAHRETVDGLAVTFLALGDAHLELLEPTGETGEDGPVGRFLDRDGPGLHHVAFATDDLRDALAHARECGVALVDEEPRPGAWGHDVAFLHPDSTGGVLVELVERG